MSMRGRKFGSGRRFVGLVLAVIAAGWHVAARSAGSAQSPAAAVVPFTIHVPDAVLTDLKDRLARTRYPDQVDGAGARHQIQSGAAQPGGRAGAGTDPRRVEVPSACVSWPNDVGFTPRKWNEAQYNLKRFTIMPQGGHFGAFEEPQLYLDDVRAFFKDVR